MNYKKQLGTYIGSLMLLVALMLPTAIQFFHSFEEHEQIDCTEQEAHVHKTITKCEVCSFHLASFDYEIATYPDLSLPEIHELINADYTSAQLDSFNTTSTQLRAPPVLS